MNQFRFLVQYYGFDGRINPAFKIKKGLFRKIHNSTKKTQLNLSIDDRNQKQSNYFLSGSQIHHNSFAVTQQQHQSYFYKKEMSLQTEISSLGREYGQNQLGNRLNHHLNILQHQQNGKLNQCHTFISAHERNNINHEVKSNLSFANLTNNYSQCSFMSNRSKKQQLESIRQQLRQIDFTKIKTIAQSKNTRK